MNKENIVDFNVTTQAFEREVIDRTFYAESFNLAENNKDFLVDALEKVKLERIIEVLEHHGLQELIDEEMITFAAIKPRTEKSKLNVDKDTEGEQLLLSLIKPPLKPIFTITLAPTSEDLDRFYPQELRDRLSQLVEGDSNAWDNFKKYMQTGPTTYMLLFDENGDAVREWRNQMGATNPLNAEPNSIRGKYALSIRQNLVHGSSGDTTEERVANVRLESDWLLDQLRQMKQSIDETEIDSQFIGDEELKELGVITEGERIVLLKRLFPFKRAGAESFLSAYSVAVEKADGTIDFRYLAQKAIVSFGGPKQKAQDMHARLQLLDEQGANIPIIYGIKGADIFQEYILNAESSSVGIDMIKSESTTDDVKIDLISQLVKMAYALDLNGFSPLNFLSDTVFDGHKFIFLDAGSDLGGANKSKPNNSSLNALLNKFKRTPFEKVILDRYKNLDSKNN